jgi:hypothetical protein
VASITGFTSFIHDFAVPVQLGVYVLSVVVFLQLAKKAMHTKAKMKVAFISGEIILK